MTEILIAAVAFDAHQADRLAARRRLRLVATEITLVPDQEQA